MDAERFRRAVDAALVPVVASVGPWGVLDAHWRPDGSGAPVVWLRTRTRAQADALRPQVWLQSQVQLTLSRLDVSHEVVRRLRIEVTSAEDEAALFGE